MPKKPRKTNTRDMSQAAQADQSKWEGDVHRLQGQAEELVVQLAAKLDELKKVGGEVEHGRVFLKCLENLAAALDPA
ncbi:MAG TPA: hypothetical protein VIJ91_13285 [Candidatus Dormibacteraeota bacterium]|jgi:hypothetical protein